VWNKHQNFHIVEGSRWMNGQHLRSLPTEELASMLGNQWVKAGILSEYQEAFVNVSVIFGHPDLECVFSLKWR
jgi:hypothetical protein